MIAKGFFWACLPSLAQISFQLVSQTLHCEIHWFILLGTMRPFNCAASSAQTSAQTFAPASWYGLELPSGPNVSGSLSQVSHSPRLIIPWIIRSMVWMTLHVVVLINNYNADMVSSWVSPSYTMASSTWHDDVFQLCCLQWSHPSLWFSPASWCGPPLPSGQSVSDFLSPLFHSPGMIKPWIIQSMFWMTLHVVVLNNNYNNGDMVLSWVSPS